MQRAVDYILRARNPYAAWRYDVPPIGDNDTSVTGWMLAALVEARDAGYRLDHAAFEGGVNWIEEVTDPVSGRVGYDSVGSLSSRTPTNEHYPRQKGEAMTAIGLASRIEVDGRRDQRGTLNSHARLLRRTLPAWDPQGFGIDMYYWYHGTRAMKAMGGATGRSGVPPCWRRWCPGNAPKASRPAPGTRSGPGVTAAAGSYATALMAIVLAECLDG